MDVRRAYCSAVDRNVPVVLRPGPAPWDGRTPHDPSELVCLDYKVRCTGWCCPLMSVDEDLVPVPAGARRPADRHASDEPRERKKRWAPPT